MDRKTPIPPSPFGAIVSAPAVRAHLTQAGKELALALQEGLKTVAGQVQDADLMRQYPYLEAALGNLLASVARLTGTPRTKKGTNHGRRARRTGKDRSHAGK